MGFETRGAQNRDISKKCSNRKNELYRIKINSYWFAQHDCLKKEPEICKIIGIVRLNFKFRDGLDLTHT